MQHANQHATGADLPTSGSTDLLAGKPEPVLPEVFRPNYLMTTPEAASYLGVSSKTLETWRSKGRYGLRYIRVGNRVRYRIEDLNEWLASRSQEHTGQALGE